MKVVVNGYELELFTIGYTAKLLDMSTETIRAWERDGILPKPMFKYGNGVRLYHPKEVYAIRRVMKKKSFRNRYKVKEKLKHEIWTNLAVARQEILKLTEREEEHSQI